MRSSLHHPFLPPLEVVDFVGTPVGSGRRFREYAADLSSRTLVKKRRRLLRQGEFQRVLSRPRLLTCRAFLAFAQPSPSEGRVGIAVSRNLKSAVRRNRVRRRLREAVRLELLQPSAGGSPDQRLGIALDVVLIARPSAETLQFTQLTEDVARLRRRLLADAAGRSSAVPGLAPVAPRSTGSS